MNTSVNALGNILRTSRKDRNLSQEALAERVGVCKRTIMNIENNAGNPKFDLLCLLIRELDLPLYKIFYPEMVETADVKNTLIKEICDCSDYEIRIILSIIKGLRCALKADVDFSNN